MAIRSKEISIMYVGRNRDLESRRGEKGFGGKYPIMGWRYNTTSGPKGHGTRSAQCASGINQLSHRRTPLQLCKRKRIDSTLLNRSCVGKFRYAFSGGQVGNAWSANGRLKRRVDMEKQSPRDRKVFERNYRNKASSRESSGDASRPPLRRAQYYTRKNFIAH